MYRPYHALEYQMSKLSNMYVRTMIIKVLNIPLYTCKVSAFIEWYTVRLFWTLSHSSNLLFSATSVFNRENLHKVKA